MVRDLVRGKHDIDETMGSAFLVQFIGSLLVTVLSMGVCLLPETRSSCRSSCGRDCERKNRCLCVSGDRLFGSSQK